MEQALLFFQSYPLRQFLKASFQTNYSNYLAFHLDHVTFSSIVSRMQSEIQLIIELTKFHDITSCSLYIYFKSVLKDCFYTIKILIRVLSDASYNQFYIKTLSLNHNLQIIITFQKHYLIVPSYKIFYERVLRVFYKNLTTFDFLMCLIFLSNMCL